MARVDEESRELKLLVDRREDLVAMRTATNNRLLARVHELDPSTHLNSVPLKYAKHREALNARLMGPLGCSQNWLAPSCLNWRSSHALKSVPDPWPVFAVRDIPV